jgi:hypothetical protein
MGNSGLENRTSAFPRKRVTGGNSVGGSNRSLRASGLRPPFQFMGKKKRMATCLSGAACRAYCCLAIALLLPTAVRAHVKLDSPNGGEILNIGSTFMIEWHPIIEHDTIDWDLWYSITSSNGPWEVLSLDLPLGNPVAGSNHSYNWLVPDLDNTNAWVRVRQDNGFQDYFDESDASFSIVAQMLAGDFDEDYDVDGSDFLKWQRGEFTNPPSQSDLEVWLENFGKVSSPITAASTGVPEPTTWIMLLLGMASLLFRRNLEAS